MAEGLDLFKLSWHSLSFKRHLSSVIRNAILGAFGIVVFVIGFLVGMMWLYILGACIGGVFLLWAAAELVILLTLSLRAKKHGVICRAVPYKVERARTQNRYHLELNVMLPDGKKVNVPSQGPLWEVDARVMLDRSIKVIFLGEDRTAIILPE